MARKPNQQRYAQIYRQVQQTPGQRPGAIAQRLGLSRSEVTRALPGMEQSGYYLSEDERGGLWPYRQNPPR